MVWYCFKCGLRNFKISNKKIKISLAVGTVVLHTAPNTTSAHLWLKYNI